MTPNLRFWSVTQTGVVFQNTKPDTLKKEANFVVFIRNYKVYTSDNLTRKLKKYSRTRKTANRFLFLISPCRTTADTLQAA